MPATMEEECHPSGTIRMKATDFSIAAIIGRDGEQHKPSSPESAKPLPLSVFTFGESDPLNFCQRNKVVNLWPFDSDRMSSKTVIPPVGETLLVRSPKIESDDADEKDVDVEQFSDAGDVNAERRVSPSPSLSDDAETSSKGGDLDDDVDESCESNTKSSKKSSATSSQVKPRCNCDDLMAIDCHLETKELWDKFHELGTEMIITKTGRLVARYRLFISWQPLRFLRPTTDF